MTTPGVKQLLKRKLKNLPIFGLPLFNIMRGIKNRLSPQKKYLVHKIYGKIFYPYYNLFAPLNNLYPDIYNHEGKKIELYFIRDVHGIRCVGRGVLNQPYKKIIKTCVYLFIDNPKQILVDKR